MSTLANTLEPATTRRFTIRSVAAGITGSIERFTNTPYWRLKTVVMLFVISFIFSTPYSLNLPLQLNPADISKCKTCSQQWRWGISYFSTQFNNPFSSAAIEFLKDKPHTDGFVSHLDKRWSRITVPFIAWLLHLNMTHIYYLQVLLSFVFLFFVIRLMEFSTGDKILAFAATVSVGCLYLFKTFTVDFIHYDCFAFLFLVLAACQKKALLSIPFLLLAAFTDERAVVTFPMWFLLKLITDQGISFSLKDVFKRLDLVFSFSFAIIGYLLLRHMLKLHLQVTEDNTAIGIGMIGDNLKALPLAVFATLEGTLVLIAIPAVIGFLNKNFLFATLYSLSVLGSFATAFMVADLSRSISYLFPAIFISLVFMKQSESLSTARLTAVGVMLFCALFPTNDYAGRPVAGESWILPIFYKLFKNFGLIIL